MKRIMMAVLAVAIFGAVSVAKAEIKIEIPDKIYRTAGVANGMPFYGPVWNGDEEIVQGWADDGNNRFPQYHYHVEYTEDKACIKKFIQGKSMEGCTSKR